MWINLNSISLRFFLNEFIIIVVDHCPNIINEIKIDYNNDISELSSTSLNILHLNTRSCRNKIDELTQMMYELNKTIHVIVFSETWLYENEICNIALYFIS